MPLRRLSVGRDHMPNCEGVVTGEDVVVKGL